MNLASVPTSDDAWVLELLEGEPDLLEEALSREGRDRKAVLALHLGRVRQEQSDDRSDGVEANEHEVTGISEVV